MEDHTPGYVRACVRDVIPRPLWFVYDAVCDAGVLQPSLSFSCTGLPFVSITDARLYFCSHMINVVAPRRDVEP